MANGFAQGGRRNLARSGAAGLGLLALMSTACAGMRPPATSAPLTSFSHDDLDRVLQRHVDDAGRVDYGGLARNRQDLDRYQAFTARMSPDSHPALFPTEPQRLTYWINAYNAAVLVTVLAHYPIGSVLEVRPPRAAAWLPEGAGSSSSSGSAWAATARASSSSSTA